MHYSGSKELKKIAIKKVHELLEEGVIKISEDLKEMYKIAKKKDDLADTILYI